MAVQSRDLDVPFGRGEVSFPLDSGRMSGHLIARQMVDLAHGIQML